MGKATFTSNRGPFMSKNNVFINLAMGKLAMAVDIALKSAAGMPVDTGNMKSETRFFKSAEKGYRVEVDVAYAAYQERGVRLDGTHVVHNYTTGGTGAGFFERAIEIMNRQRDGLIKEAAKAAGLSS